MRIDMIEAIGIEPDGSFWVRPSTTSFPMIYREANEMRWNHKQRRLHTPKPREWSYVDWYNHILSTVKGAGIELRLTPDTQWIGIDADLRCALEAV